MKKTAFWVMIICCIMQLQLASAQSAELEQLALDIEKLAQFKQILSQMKAGYTTLYNGYSTIKNISQGNFSLHENYLNGLLLINPEINRYKRVGDIIQKEATILSEYRTAFNRFKSGGRFSGDEIDYIGKVYSNLFSECMDDLEELTDLLTANKLRMTDDDRIKGIDRLDTDMSDKLAFLRSFNKRTGNLDTQRARELQSSQDLKGLYGIK